MVSLGLLLGCSRWALTLYMAFNAPMRIGELLTGVRRQLVLPEDMWSQDHGRAYVYIRDPKSGLRGGARRQHATLRCPRLIAAFTRVYGPDPDGARLYPSSASACRSRWGRVLAMLRIPKELKLTPGGIRGGGCVAMRVDGAPMADIQWAMRVQSLKTLEHYLQEVGACVSLRDAPPLAKQRVLALSGLFDVMLDVTARRP